MLIKKDNSIGKHDSMFEILYKVIIFLTFIYSFYYTIMAVFAFFKTSHIVNNSKKNYFSILIAARNEEKVIKSLIDSLKKQNYDKSYYDINVIINNCNDDTEKIAEKSGVSIINCDIPVTCKGDALKYAFNKLKDNQKIDAYIIFDADNVVHPDFLNQMNNSINNGYKVAQGTRETKNINQSWISSSYAIYYYLQNFFISRSRKNIKLSATINGTGFMVKKEIIDTIGFNTCTLTEDIEFSCICALNKIKIDYVEKAITYDEQASSFKTSWNQRIRWTKGTLQCLNIYGFKLIINFFKTWSLTNIDLFFLYLAPIIQIVSFLAILVRFLIQLFSLNIATFINTYLFISLISLIMSYLIIIIVSIFLVKYNRHSLKEFLGGILLFSVFILSWLPICIISLFKRKITWNPIKHNSNISINEIIKK